MKLVAIMPCRNSAWALRLTVQALMLWADELIMLDHASTDATPDIMRDLEREYPERVLPHLSHSDGVWAEMSHRQALLEAARGRGATHIITIDDDELITGNLIEHIRGLYERLQPHRVLTIPWLCMRGAHDRVQVGDGVWSCQDVSVGFIDAPALHWQARSGYDFHHRHPMGMPYDQYRPIGSRRYGLMHLQFSSERRLRAKQALYKMIEVIRWPTRSSVAAINRMYDLAVYGSYDPLRPDQQTEQAMPEWWATYAERGWLDLLDLNAEPWQEAECRRLWAHYGPLKFEGLDLFGVVS